jgi:hypothetical protein
LLRNLRELGTVISDIRLVRDDQVVLHVATAVCTL